MPAPASADPARPTVPSFSRALRFWLKLGLISFGGPAGQIAILHDELVERRRWIAEGPFLHALNFCMLLPGPEAQQLVTYIGWRLHGIAGALAAGGLFVLPGAVIMLVLAWVAAAHGDWQPVAAVFYGIKPIVIAIIVHAVWRIGRRALTGPAAVVLAVLAFVGIFFLGVPFPVIVLAAALIGVAASRMTRDPFAPEIPVSDEPNAKSETVAPGGAWRVLRLIAIFAVLWAVPVLAVVAVWGADPFTDVATLFTKAAFVTFGGAYAVLPYIADAAVYDYAWLDPGEMANGLALAESTPGPLILVTQYVGFFAGWTGVTGSLASAVIAAALTTYVTFLPCFLFILAGAPYIERLHGNRLAASALGAITAAVVGVIANLGVFLGLVVLFPGGTVDWTSLVLTAVATLVLFVRPVATHWMVLVGAAVGLAVWYGGLAGMGGG